MRLWAKICVAAAVAASFPAWGEDLQVLPAPNDTMMTAYLNGLADAAFERRAADRDALVTPEQIVAYQDKLRQFFLDQLRLPERTPLNARVLETGQKETFRYEKILFESRPRFYVTAILFLPLSAPPYPGVLVPCGHSANGKAMENYQKVCILLAQNGIAALIYDPIGQGERGQILDENGKQRFGGTIEHTFTGVSCIPLGTSTAAIRIWDGIRAIDYLCERPEIDAGRIGCTGNSGGGTMTSYLMALDPRIMCAAPSCYLTSLRRLLEKEGPQDAEQNIHGQIAAGMDHADYVMMRAPKPTLMCTATYDFFDIRGAWDSFRDAKRLYTKLGAPEMVALVEANEKHGFTPPLRQAAVRWMCRHLLKKDEPIVEPAITVLTEAESQCTPQGQVMLLEGARSAFDFNVEAQKELAGVRQAYLKQASKDELRAKVRELAAMRPLAELPQPEIEQAGTLARDGYLIEKLVIKPEPGIVLPALAFVPAEPAGDALLYLHGMGKAADAAPGGAIETLVRETHRIVLAPDLRGMGETAGKSSHDEYDRCFGIGWKDFFRAYMLGKTYAGMRAEDILICARFLAGYRNNGGAPRPVHALAIGDACVPALHAAAVEPDAIASLRRQDAPIASWTELMPPMYPKAPMLDTIHGALRYYDLPDLEACLQ